MTKAKQLLIAILLLIPLFFAMSQAAEHSKKVIKGNIDLCDNLDTGTIGYVKGVVVSNRKDEWTHYHLATIKEGKEGCPLTIKHKSNVYLTNPGSKVRALIKISSDGYAELLNNKVKEDVTVLDENGEVTPTKHVDLKLAKSLVNYVQSSEINSLYTDEFSLRFPKEMSRKLKPSVKFRIYYQERQRGSSVVTNVEEVN